MTFFKEWLVTAETNEILFENALNYIQKKYILEESERILLDLFNLIENEDDDDEPFDDTPPWLAGSEDAKPVEETPEEEEGWSNDWWKDSRVLMSGYTSPSLSEINSDENFRNRLNELYSYMKNSAIFLRAKEIEKFKELIEDHVKYTNYLVSKQNNGEKILVRNIAELNDKKQRIIKTLKKLGYCSSEELDTKNKKHEFSPKIKKCIKSCLEEKNNYQNFSFDEREYEENKSEFLQMIEIILKKRVNKIKGSLLMQSPPVDPDEFKDFLRDLLINKVISRVTMTGKLRSEKEWKSLDVTQEDKGFLGFVLKTSGKQTMFKFRSFINTQKGGSGSGKQYRSRILSDIKDSNPEILDIYRYWLTTEAERNRIHSKIIKKLKSGKFTVGKANKTRIEISSYLKQFIDNYEELDVSMVEDDEGLKEVLKLFARNFKTGSSQLVTSLDSMSNDEDSSVLDLVTSTGKSAKVPKSMAFIGDEDIIGSSGDKKDLNVSRIPSQEKNPVIVAVHNAFEKLINDPPIQMKQEKHYSEKLQRQVSYNELLALIIAIKYGVGYTVSPVGEIKIDSSQGILISRSQGEKSQEISRIIKDKLGIEINPTSLRGKKWIGAAEEFMRRELSSLNMS